MTSPKPRLLIFDLATPPAACSSKDGKLTVTWNDETGPDVARNPSIANAPIPTTIAARGTAPAPLNEKVEEHEESPEYVPGPDDQLSRSYGIDAKTAPTAIPTADAASPTTSTATGAGAQNAPSIAATDYAETTAPTTRSAGSGHNQQGSTFANGAAVTGPNGSLSKEEEAALHERSATAETGLSEKTKNRLSKAELKDNKRLSKIIRAEGKAEAAALRTAITELAQLQTQQVAATKREATAHKTHAKALALHMKTESKYMALKAEYEKNLGDMRGKEEALAVEQANAREVSERTAEKAREVERLRLQSAADDRERERKLVEMGQSGGGFLCF